MDSETDQLVIVNRSTEYHISKKLLCKIPYFEKLLSHECLESSENKVQLDFDEKVFKRFLNWIQFDKIFVGMDYVINLCTMADYFGISDCLTEDFVKYFHDNFTIEHLPVIIPQVTAASKLINSGALNNFICRYFTKIVNTTVWLDYPIETVEYICALDLMIHSEYQVFDAIMKWVTCKAVFRKCYFKGLFKLIRWCHWEDKDLSKINENEFVRSSDFEPELESHDKLNCRCIIDRTKQGCFLMAEELNETHLRVQVFDSNFLPLINIVIQSDELMPLHVLHDEYVSDISFDSGRKMIRIDWKHSKYRLLDFPAFKSYSIKIYRCIAEYLSRYLGYSVKTQEGSPTSEAYEGSLLEAVEKFTLVRNDQHYFMCWKNPSFSDINSQFIKNHPTYLATILDNNIYVLNHKHAFFQLNIDRDLEFKKIGLQRLEGILQFNNSLLTSKQANDDKVYVLDKITKDVFCFNVSTQKWKSIGRIIDSNSKSADGQKISNVKTFTFGFVSTDSINLCLKRKFTQ